MKREMTSVDIAAVVRELKDLEGAKFDKFYLYSDGKFRFKIRDIERGRLDLIIQVGDIKRIHLVEEAEDAPTRPPNLAMLMRKRLSGGTISSIEQHGFDRVVKIKGKRDEEYICVSELFGDGNFAFLDSDLTVLSCLDTVRLKSRTIAGGEKYEFPSSQINPFQLSFEEFQEVIEESSTDVVRSLASKLSFGGNYAEEICKRANIEKEKPIEKTTKQNYKDLFSAIQEIEKDLESSSPCIVYKDEEAFDVLPIKLEKYREYKTEDFDSFNRALEVYFEGIKTQEEKQEKDLVEQKIEKQKAIINQQEGAIEDFKKQEESLKEKAELLYKNYGKIDELLNVIKDARDQNLSWGEIEEKLKKGKQKDLDSALIFDSFKDGKLYVDVEDRNIELEVDMGVEKNANRLYEKAKEIKQKREGAKQAKKQKKQELKQLKKQKEKPQKTKNQKQKKPEKRSEEWYHRFRWFHTSDDFLVIGGRNADQNDEIYKKYMEKQDLFFHTKAKGGPITILKTTKPEEPKKENIEIPQQSKREAAIFAASYSNLWKQGRHAAKVYSVKPNQVSKTPESGEYIEKGAVVVRGKRNYHKVPLRISIGLKLKEKPGIIGGPPTPIQKHAKHILKLEPGRYTKTDTAKKIYRKLTELNKNTQKLTSIDEIQRYLPPGKSRLTSSPA